MDFINFKLDVICDISYLNEESSSLEMIPSGKIEKERLHEASLSFLKGSQKDETILLKYHQKAFLSYFLQTMRDLEKWVKGKEPFSWEEDDVGFLNFLLHSSWLYSEKMKENYPDYLKELIQSVLCPLILSLTKKDPFFHDLDFWFSKEGDALFESLSLAKEEEILKEHFSKTKTNSDERFL